MLSIKKINKKTCLLEEVIIFAVNVMHNRVKRIIPDIYHLYKSWIYNILGLKATIIIYAIYAL